MSYADMRRVEDLLDPDDNPVEYDEFERIVGLWSGWKDITPEDERTLASLYDKYGFPVGYRLYRTIVNQSVADDLRASEVGRTITVGMVDGFTSNYSLMYNEMDVPSGGRVMLVLKNPQKSLPLNIWGCHAHPEEDEHLVGGMLRVTSVKYDPEEQDTFLFVEQASTRSVDTQRTASPKTAWNNRTPVKTHDEAVGRFGQDFVDVVMDWKAGAHSAELAEDRMAVFYNEYAERTSKTLYRGVNLREQVSIGDIIKPYRGRRMTSWSEDSGYIEKFLAERSELFGVYPYTLVINGAYGLFLDRIPNGLSREVEWALAGDFRVVGELGVGEFGERVLSVEQVGGRQAKFIQKDEATEGLIRTHPFLNPSVWYQDDDTKATLGYMDYSIDDEDDSVAIVDYIQSFTPNQGTGRRMMDEFEDYVRAENPSVDTIQLVSLPQSNGFYDALGYEETYDTNIGTSNKVYEKRIASELTYSVGYAEVELGNGYKIQMWDMGTDWECQIANGDSIIAYTQAESREAGEAWGREQFVTKTAEFVEYDYHVNVFSDIYGPKTVRNDVLTELARDNEAKLTVAIGDYDKIPTEESISEIRQLFDSGFGPDSWLSTPGNHEAQYEDGEPISLTWYWNHIGWGYVDYQGDNVAYKMVDKDAYVLMNSAFKEYDQDALDELRSVLSTLYSARHIFVFTHVPFVDPTIGENKEDHAITIPINTATEFSSMMEAHNVTVVFFSHQHSYETWTKNGVLYVITAGGGSPLDELDEEYHYVRMDVGEFVRVERSPLFPTEPQKESS